MMRIILIVKKGKEFLNIMSAAKRFSDIQKHEYG